MRESHASKGGGNTEMRLKMGCGVGGEGHQTQRRGRGKGWGICHPSWQARWRGDREAGTLMRKAARAMGLIFLQLSGLCPPWMGRFSP